MALIDMHLISIFAIFQKLCFTVLQKSYNIPMIRLDIIYITFRHNIFKWFKHFELLTLMDFEKPTVILWTFWVYFFVYLLVFCMLEMCVSFVKSLKYLSTLSYCISNVNVKKSSTYFYYFRYFELLLLCFIM